MQVDGALQRCISASVAAARYGLAGQRPDRWRPRQRNLPELRPTLAQQRVPGTVSRRGNGVAAATSAAKVHPARLWWVSLPLQSLQLHRLGELVRELGL